MEEGTSQFCRSAGRCGAMRRGVHAGMPLGCPQHAAAKGNACTRACCQGQGHGHGHGSPNALAAKAKAKARSQGHGMLAWARWHAPRGTLACLWVQAAGPLGARWHAPRCRQQGPWGGMPRPWHALGTPRGPWQHLGGLLLPGLDSLFGHLLLFPP